MSIDDVSKAEEICRHCASVLYLVRYTWFVGERIETTDRGTELGPIVEADPPGSLAQGSLLVCHACDGDAVQRAVKRK